MRVGINTLFLVPGDVGGTEVYLRSTLLALAGMESEDTFVLFTNDENDSLFRNEFKGCFNVEVHRVPCRAAIRPVRILVEQLLLPFAAQKQSVDVLWSPGYTAPVFCRMPQAVTIHDLQYKSHPEDMKLSERLVLDALVRSACRSCDAVITISDFSKQEILCYGFAKEKKIHAILEGVSDFFAAASLAGENEQDSALKKMGIQKPFLLCVAHTYPHKNVDKLVDAFSKFSRMFPHQLVLVGKARRGEKKVLESLKGVNDPNRVLRFSGLSQLELKLLYQHATVFILPSCYEGFGLPVLEAMMAGVPVISPKMASLPEVGGEFTFYVDAPESELFLERIIEVIELSTTQHDIHIRDARLWARGFTWEKTAAQTIQVLKSVVEKTQ